jgi:CubicO group peptidase (beta-lactamase class C family)
MKRMCKYLTQTMDETTARGETPCALTLVWHNGKEAFFHASGYADLGKNVPACRDTIFRLFSLTKPMTAAAAMTLVERGELDLLAPVSDYLEGFKNQRVALSDDETEPVKRAVQVRDLFSMTSGLCYPGDATPAERAMARLFADVAAQEEAGLQPDTLTLASRIGQAPLAFQPGEKWMYGTSADVLGAVVEAASGQPLDEYMADALFQPLGMKDTGFFVPEEKLHRFATLYEHKNGLLSPFLDNHLGLNSYLTRPNYIAGGAGAVSTIDDVLRFARMLLDGGTVGNTRVLSPRSVQWLSHNHLSTEQLAALNWDSLYGYGYGGLMRVLMEPARSFSLGDEGEFGWDGWTGPYMSVNPKAHLILLVFLQRTDSGITPLTRKVRNIVYSRVG